MCRENPRDGDYCLYCENPMYLTKSDDEDGGGTGNDAGNKYIGEDFEDHLVYVVLVTIFYYIIFGIIAVYYSAKARGQMELGAYGLAEENAENALTWCNLEFIVGIFIIVLYCFIAVIPYI